MKLIKFGSLSTFVDWFYRNNRNNDYPMTDINRNLYLEEDTHIYRAVEKGKDVGVIFASCFYGNEMWIDLFEIKKGQQRKGFGTEMFGLLMEKHKPNWVQLQCAEERGDNREAHDFWKKMGFHHIRSAYIDDLMRKTYTKKYWENYNK